MCPVYSIVPVVEAIDSSAAAGQQQQRSVTVAHRRIDIIKKKAMKPHLLYSQHAMPT